MQHFIWDYTVCQSNHLGDSGPQMVKDKFCFSVLMNAFPFQFITVFMTKKSSNSFVTFFPDFAVL